MGFLLSFKRCHTRSELDIIIGCKKPYQRDNQHFIDVSVQSYERCKPGEHVLDSGYNEMVQMTLVISTGNHLKKE